MQKKYIFVLQVTENITSKVANVFVVDYLYTQIYIQNVTDSKQVQIPFLIWLFIKDNLSPKIYK